MFPADLQERAARLLEVCRARGHRIVTAESCTGGLIVALLTEIPGSSDVVERSFVTYSNAAKQECLGVPAALLQRHGAVSGPVARAMAEGALSCSRADLAVSNTGIAGPRGSSGAKPVGLVHLGVSRRGGPTLHRECHFGDIGRDQVRIKSVEAGLELLSQLLPSEPALP